MARNHRTLPLLILTLLAALALAPSALAAPTTFTVNSSDDPGDGTCDATECTLREAIAAANANAGADTIAFDAGAAYIAVGSTLPAITESVTIDGTTQPDSTAGFPLVEIDGSSLASGDGLSVTGGSLTLKRVIVENFPGIGVRLGGAGSSSVTDSLIQQNGDGGITVASSNNTIGGVSAGAANTITSNSVAGVAVTSGTGTAVRGNDIDFNDGLGIDLGADGVTADDANDADSGANGLQNFPVLSTTSGGASSLTVNGSLASAASTSYTIDFYSIGSCDPSGFGEGEKYIGSAPVTTDGAGHASFSPTFAGDYTGQTITATATGPSGTSEFSGCVAAPAAPPPDPTSAQKLIASSGPLYGIYLNQTMSCQVLHSGDQSPEFFSGTSNGACGTFLATGNTVYGPTVPAGQSRTDYTFVSQSAVTGSGTVGDPYRVTTIGDAGATGLRVTRTDSYVVGQEAYRSDIKVQNTGGSAATATLYHAGDCYLQDSDSGHGYYDGSTGGIYCTKNANNSPPGRIEGFVPLTAGSHYMEDGYSTVWSAITSTGTAFPDTCACTSDIDNGAGLSWALSIPAGQSVTRSLVTAFSPNGVLPDTTPPSVTLVTPADGATTGDTTPTYSGAAGNEAGDLNQITVTIYNGPNTSGTVAQTVTIDRNGAAWTVDGSTPLAPGTYTAVASQSDASGNVGTSAPHTFTVVASTVDFASDVTVTEGDSGTVDATFTVNRTGTTGSASVQWATSSGTATSGTDFVAGSGTLNFAPGDASKTITVKVNGDTLDENDETFNVDLSSPTNVSIGDGHAVGTITDDDAAPSVTINDPTATEGSPLGFTVTLSAASGKTVTVDYATANGTASAPGDYTAKSGTVTFAPGETSKPVSVATVQDTADEPDETLTVGLTNPVNTTIADNSGLGTITDDDAPPTVSVSDASATEGSPLAFTVSLSTASGKTVTVDYATADGTAAQPGDYTAKSGTVTFAPGETSKPVSVATVQDALDEVDETLTVGLTNPSNATIADGSGAGTIHDDDGPAVSINDVTVDPEGDSGSKDATFTVSLSATSVQPVSVTASTADGTATAGADYTAKSATVTVPAGETAATFTVAVLGDTLDEPDETFTVGLSSPVNGTIADGSGIGTIVDDDVAVSPPVVPVMSIGNATVDPEGDSGTTPATFTVTLSQATTVPVSAHYQTADGSATQPGDYTATSGTVTIPAGQTSAQVGAPVVGDTLDEPDETFTVGLSSPSGVTLGAATGTATIVDDDAPPPDTDVPGKIRADGLFCGTQHRGHCVGLKIDSDLAGPGNASWQLGAYNPSPGKGGKSSASAAAIKLIKLATITKTVKKAGHVRVVFKFKGAKARRLLGKVRHAHATRLRVTTTFKPAGGGAPTKDVDTVRLK